MFVSSAITCFTCPMVPTRKFLALLCTNIRCQHCPNPHLMSSVLVLGSKNFMLDQGKWKIHVLL